MSDRVFVSYSHLDAALVRPVVQLLRATKDFVFLDVDSIRPGRTWKPQIEDALSKAGLVVVFWCHYSRDSDQVSSEWSSALSSGKNVLPLLLDRTPLPATLERYEWVDFCDVVGPLHAAPEPGPVRASVRPTPSEPSRPFWSSRPLLLAAATAAIALPAVAIGFLMTAAPAASAGPFQHGMPIVTIGYGVAVMLACALGLLVGRRHLAKRRLIRELDLQSTEAARIASRLLHEVRAHAARAPR